MLSGHDVAKYFLAQTNEEAGDLMSNLKLQKLLYYAQGFNLALYDEPLFPESIEAWTYGPVVPEVYRAYKKYDSGAIPIPEDIDFSKYDQQSRELLDEVYSVYGQFSAWKLVSLILEEEPWKNAREGDLVITHQAMKKYFKNQLVNADE
ncbi:SocA family protein [Anabaena sphaerica FACHB-251]|uniref:SocA family protein n=1 Tax=Anabaena sphaerica FACHB-251 TaxID=2692883 RepID=A0A926WHN4_9NOST|nr:type II toxin-antitoxin system antitoxin SocA domain-containing protein [Anabaena sphaerica]MBD2293666.1 SocA family protein [Anabaena sphaerica FACHB-251]